MIVTATMPIAQTRYLEPMIKHGVSSHGVGNVVYNKRADEHAQIENAYGKGNARGPDRRGAYCVNKKDYASERLLSRFFFL